jgi:hypothetical protein
MSFSNIPVTRVEPDDEVTSDDRNYLAAEIEARTVIPGPGLEAQRTPAGTLLRVVMRGELLGALSPGGGINCATGSPPTPGSATCQLYDLVGSGPWPSKGISDVVYNDYTSVTNSTGVAASTYVICYRAADGTIRVLGEPCP